MDIFERGEQFVVRGLFEQIAGGTRLESLKNVVGILVHRVHHKLGSLHFWLQPADTFHPVHPWQINIH